MKNNNYASNQPVMFTGISLEELKNFFTEVLEEQLGRKLFEHSDIYFNGVPIGGKKSKESKAKDSTVYLTRGEVCNQLQISLPTLHNYTKDGLIKSYRIGGKVRYKAHEIEQALTERNFSAVNRRGGNHAA